MKKAIAKQLRQLAESLPPLYIDKVMGTKITGAELLKNSQDNSLKYIDESAIYKQKYLTRVPVNHYNNLKSGYKSIGPSIVPQYMQAVKSVVEQLKLEEETKLNNIQNQENADTRNP